MNPPTKRPLPSTSSRPTKKQWRTPKKNQSSQPTNAAISPGDAGIWATCDMHKEGRATAELRDLFEEYAKIIYDSGGSGGGSSDGKGEKGEGTEAGGGVGQGEEGEGEEGEGKGVEGERAKGKVGDTDIETAIEEEIRDLKASSSSSAFQEKASGQKNHHQQPQQQRPLFEPVKVDVPCVIFFRTRPPVEPVAFVQRICRDAASKEGPRRRTRCVRRLTPVVQVGRASWEGLRRVGERVLGEALGGFGREGVKFAIRPTIRNHSVLKRDEVIKEVAQMVGPGYSVDLKYYDCLILVEIYRNVLGMSVVGGDYDWLKRFNLAEIWDPTPSGKQASNGKGGEAKDVGKRPDQEFDGTVESAVNSVDGKSATEPPASETRIPNAATDDNATMHGGESSK